MSVRSRGARFAATFVVALAAGASLAQPAAATAPGANGRIVVRSSMGLSTVNPDGTGVRTLTTDGADEAPAWSPDGGRIAFDKAGVLYVMNADGTGAHSLGVRGYDPTWSPDGTRIAFVDSDGLWVMNADGTGLVDISDTPDGAPRWSPDGSKIAFPRYDLATNNSAIWVMDPDGDNATELFDNDAQNASIDWSPDGSKLVFDTFNASNGPEHQIVVIDSNGSNPRQLTSVGSNGTAVFSPDGTRIAFWSSRAEGLWIMNADGTNQARVTTADIRGGGPDWQPLHLTLDVSKSKVTYNGAVTLTVHLLEAASANKLVSIFATPHGEEAQLIASEAVDGSGNFSVTVNVPKRTTFHATWSGDDDHPAGGVSESRLVLVYAQLSGRLTRYYSSARGYRLYHYTNACPNRQRGCPTYVVSIAPDHAGQRLYFTLQLRSDGRWRTVLNFSEQVPDTNRIVELFVYGNRSIIGLPTRVQARFRGDADHLATRTPWAYFKVTR